MLLGLVVIAGVSYRRIINAVTLMVNALRMYCGILYILALVVEQRNVECIVLLV
jgi:hypothetical protein